MDTLAVRLTIPPVRLVKDFHLQVSAPCRAHQEKGIPEILECLFFINRKQGVYTLKKHKCLDEDDPWFDLDLLCTDLLVRDCSQSNNVTGPVK
jgi:hypothetical protein